MSDQQPATRTGPLAGLRFVEIAGIGPGPLAGTMLADMGAEVIRVDRPVPSAIEAMVPPRYAVHSRSRRSVTVDLRSSEGVEIVLKLVESAAGLIEGFRPGVAERLGIGPEACLARNPALVYGRITGWGQDGPLAKAAGHDINYIALTGALHAIGRPGQAPVPPLNLVGDYGGGGMLLAYGMLCGVISAARTGIGQVVDAAMVDGTALLLGFISGMGAGGMWREERGTNLLDGGAPFYDVYETADGRYVSVGSLEPQFYGKLIETLGLAGEDLPAQADEARWPELRDRFAAAFRGKTRAEWCALMEGTDICFAPVLSMTEAPDHPHARARGGYVEVDGVLQPAPAPRFSGTPPNRQPEPVRRGAETDAVLGELGYAAEDVRRLREAGVLG